LTKNKKVFIKLAKGRGRGRPRREDTLTPTKLTSTPRAESASESAAAKFEDAAVSAVKKRNRRSISVISPAMAKEVFFFLVSSFFLLFLSLYQKV
jgi:hypothetical protein